MLIDRFEFHIFSYLRGFLYWFDWLVLRLRRNPQYNNKPGDADELAFDWEYAARCGGGCVQQGGAPPHTRSVPELSILLDGSLQHLVRAIAATRESEIL
jgi:hypothetical protein